MHGSFLTAAFAVWLALAMTAGACGRRADRTGESSRAAPQRDPAGASGATSEASALPPCGEKLAGIDLAPGLRVERIRAAIEPPIPIGDRCLLLVRIDPAQHELGLYTAARDGGPRTAREWASDRGLTGAINASMFTDSMRSTGLMVDGDHVNNGTDNGAFGGFFAFNPTGADPPVAMFGRGCPGFDLDAIRTRYRVVVQNYRLLDCDGGPIAWKDEKIYSAAAIATDRAGRVVFALMRTPYRMDAFSKLLAQPELDLVAAHYVEGGPEATVYLRAGGLEVEAVGSFESLFVENDDNVRAWDLPNVIGFKPRTAGRATGPENLE